MGPGGRRAAPHRQRDVHDAADQELRLALSATVPHRARPTTSPPGATTTATPCSTIARPASAATARAAKRIVGRRRARQLRVRLRPAAGRAVAAPAAQPVMIVQRVGGGGGGGDIAGAFGGGAEDKRIRFELFVVGLEPVQRRQPDRLLGRDDLAVLRPAHRGDAGAEDRCGRAGRILDAQRLRQTQRHELEANTKSVRELRDLEPSEFGVAGSAFCRRCDPRTGSTAARAPRARRRRRTRSRSRSAGSASPSPSSRCRCRCRTRRGSAPNAAPRRCGAHALHHVADVARIGGAEADAEDHRRQQHASRGVPPNARHARPQAISTRHGMNTRL